MGNSAVKTLSIAEEALANLPQSERSRLEAAFSVVQVGGLVTRDVFLNKIFGGWIPSSIGNRLFDTFGGKIKGINCREVIAGLALLARGSQDLKARFLFSLYAYSGNADTIVRVDFQRRVKLDEGYLPENVTALFANEDVVDYHVFRTWLTQYPDTLSLAAWLFRHPLRFANEARHVPTFYQSLAGITHLTESQIIELEKGFHTIVSMQSTGTISKETFCPLLSPPLPDNICSDIFRVFDEQEDDQIDLKELVCAVSYCCFGPQVERLKFVFHVFDGDQDEELNLTELSAMLGTLNALLPPAQSLVTADSEIIVDNILCNFSSSRTSLTLEEYLQWSLECSLPDTFLTVMYQICHIVFGLAPNSREDEKAIIRNWLDREDFYGLTKGEEYYLISVAWWQQWCIYVGLRPNNGRHLTSTPNSTPTSTLKNRKGRNMSIGDMETFKTAFSSVTDLGAGPSGSGTGIAPQRSNSWNHLDRMPQNRFASVQNCPQQKYGSLPKKMKAPSSTNAVSNLYVVTPAIKPGAIDNSVLVQTTRARPLNLTPNEVQLKPNLSATLGADFEVVSAPIWRALQYWYGGQPAIARRAYVSALGAAHEPQLELQLIHVTFTKHLYQSAGMPVLQQITSSIGQFLSPTSVSCQTPSVGDTTSTKRQELYQGLFSRMTTLSEMRDLIAKKLNVSADQLRLWRCAEVNEVIIDPSDANRLHTLELASFDPNISNKVLIEQRNPDMTWPEEEASRPITGLTGLMNLGNTCYMNAPLQCVSNTRGLTAYFLQQKHLYEINESNPLGHHGQIALCYGELIRSIWSGNVKSTSPSQLKTIINKYWHQFDGNEHHDAHELLAFLLDGLHEDLNRVTEKPYVELEDAKDRPDEEVASESWESHTLRNRSIMVDLLHGQLKCLVRCKTCRYETRTFDPFSYLTLPLPTDAMIYADVMIHWFDGTALPMKTLLRLPSNSNATFLLEELSRLIDVSCEFLLADVVNSGVQRFMQPTDAIRSYTALIAYELASNDEVNDLLTEEKRRSKAPRRLSNTSASSAEKQQKQQLEEHWRDLGLPAEIGSRICVVVQRRTVPITHAFISPLNLEHQLFSTPFIIPLNDYTTGFELYYLVWRKVKRFVRGGAASIEMNPPSNSFTSRRRVIDCDRVATEHSYPFNLTVVEPNGRRCSLCKWFHFCHGCRIRCSHKPFNFSSLCIAVDWDPKVLHLNYLHQDEKLHDSHSSTEQPKNPVTTVDDCLALYTTENALDDYNCPKCKEAQPAVQRLSIWRLPPVLIVNLKRMRFVNNTWVKSPWPVNVPLRDFDLSSHLGSRRRPRTCSARSTGTKISADKSSEPGASYDDIRPVVVAHCVTYELYALLCHFGAMGAGHYIAYCKNPNGKWYLYNDSQCKEVDESELRSEAVKGTAYVLFYQQTNINYTDFLPDTTGKSPVRDLQSAVELSNSSDADSKSCSVM